MDQPQESQPAARQSVASAPPWETDPRWFPFRLTCERCGEFRHSLQAMKRHLKECPGGKRRDLSCGHCCLRTSSWAEMCAHLNRPGMELQGPYQAGASLGAAPLRLLPSPTPVSVPPPVSGDAATAAAQDPSSEGLRDAASTPVRGKAAKRRRVLCSPACATPPPLAAPRVERDAASRSSPEAHVPTVSGAGPSGGPDDADPDDPVGLLLSLLDCPPTSSPPPRDFWGAPAPEDPGLGGLVDPGAAVPADVDVFPAPVGMNPQDWEDWFTWTDPLFAEDLGSVDSSAIEPAVLLASVAGSSPPSTPLVDAPAPVLETSVSASVDQTRATAEVSGAEGSSEGVPPPDRMPSPPRVPWPEVVPEADELAPAGSSEGERRPPPHDAEPTEVQRIRRLYRSCCHELRFWVESILAHGCPRLPTTGEQSARQNLMAQGHWPQMTGVATASLDELAAHFRYVYEDRLNDRHPPL